MLRSFAMRPGSTGTLSRAAMPTLAFILAFLANLANAADPIQVPRYDDADEYLPTAQRKNKDNIRLLLQQQPGEILFKVLTPRNVTVDVIANVPADADTAVILLLGGTSASPRSTTPTPPSAAPCAACTTSSHPMPK